MLRFEERAAARPASLFTLSFTLRPDPGARRAGSLIAAAASVIAFAATSGVSAESLAQPRDTALERQAAEYIRFRADVAEIEKTPFTNAKVTREAHRLLSSHDSQALSSGWVAYAALVAADTPSFRAALEKRVKKSKRRKDRLTGKDAFFADLAHDPSLPRKLDGAGEAISRILAMTMEDATRFNKLGESFKQQAYAMQKTKWGVARLSKSSARLSEADSFAHSRGPATSPTFASVTDDGLTAPTLSSADSSWDPNWGSSAGKGGLKEPNAQVIMDRVLNLAARYSFGRLNAKTVKVYAKNDHSNQCLHFANITLKQCIAATRTPYEEAFCLGQHGLNDTAGCIGWVAGFEPAE